MCFENNRRIEYASWCRRKGFKKCRRKRPKKLVLALWAFVCLTWSFHGFVSMWRGWEKRGTKGGLFVVNSDLM
jgi:hypothetical protein